MSACYKALYMQFYYYFLSDNGIGTRIIFFRLWHCERCENSHRPSDWRMQRVSSFMESVLFYSNIRNKIRWGGWNKSKLVENFQCFCKIAGVGYFILEMRVVIVWKYWCKEASELDWVRRSIWITIVVVIVNVNREHIFKNLVVNCVAR